MADPTGTVGAPQGKESDLAVVTTGGPKFMQRLQQLGDATDRHEQALARLNLGHEVEAALATATELRKTAEIDRAAAAQELVNARREAADIRNAAAQERASVAATLADAEVHLRGAHDREQRAIEADHAARQAATKAEAAQREAKAAKKTLDDKVTRLQAEIRAVAGQ
jgi:hypothetical protein